MLVVSNKLLRLTYIIHRLKLNRYR